jgi:hypothetical protein
VVDDFELQFFDWSGDANWGLSTTSKTGSFSLSDSPIGSYENNSNTWVMYNMPFDLSLYKAGEISYQLRSQLSSDADSLLFEISSDGGSSWTTLDAVTQNFIFFNNRTVDISEYTGAEFNDVRIRFRLSTNSEGTADGIYIDDVVISVSPDDASSVGAGDRIPKIFELGQNYPNPFNPSTTINFAVPVQSDVKIVIYNVIGEIVKTIIDKKMNAGSYSVSFNAGNTLSSGIYFYNINAAGIDGRNFIQTKKMILIK